jgi:hypothetical protein
LARHRPAQNADVRDFGARDGAFLNNNDGFLKIGSTPVVRPRDAQAPPMSSDQAISTYGCTPEPATMAAPESDRRGKIEFFRNWADLLFDGWDHG